MIYYEQGIVKTLNYLSYEQFVGKLGITEEIIRNERNVQPMIMSKSCNGIVF